VVGGDRSFERAASNDVQYLILSRVFFSTLPHDAVTDTYEVSGALVT